MGRLPWPALPSTFICGDPWQRDETGGARHLSCDPWSALAVSLGPDLLTRIFKTLRERQDRSAYWRPLKPITQSPRGPVLLPISVEIANSILRIHAWMCETNLAANEAQTHLASSQTALVV